LSSTYLEKILKGVKMIADNIRKLCEEHGTTLFALEEALGFGNGSLGKCQTIRSDRLQKIADYFNVTTDYIINGTAKEGYYANQETAEMMQKLFESPGRRALFKAVENMDEESVQKYAEFIERITNDNNQGN